MSKKAVSLARVLLWSSLGIENVLVIALVILRTDLEYFSSFGFEYPPEQKAELLSALTSLRWATIIPWLILANGLGIALIAGILSRVDRSRHYATLALAAVLIGIPGYFAADYMMMSRRFEAYPGIFQAQALNQSNECMGADILIQWGEEGCQYISDRLDSERGRARRIAAVTALGYVECPGRDALLWKILKTPSEHFHVRMQAGASLDWSDPVANKARLEDWIEEVRKSENMSDYSLAGMVETWMAYNDNSRRKSKDLYERLYPSACWRGVTEEEIKTGRITIPDEIRGKSNPKPDNE